MKEEYIKDRESGRVDIDMALAMYKEKTGRNMERAEFIKLFVFWIKNYKPSIDGYFTYYDEKYNIKKEDNENKE